jgi:hypothetical protein
VAVLQVYGLGITALRRGLTVIQKISLGRIVVIQVGIIVIRFGITSIQNEAGAGPGQYYCNTISSYSHTSPVLQEHIFV